jgi:hypothetical protein
MSWPFHPPCTAIFGLSFNGFISDQFAIQASA